MRVHDVVVEQLADVFGGLTSAVSVAFTADGAEGNGVAAALDAKCPQFRIVGNIDILLPRLWSVITVSGLVAYFTIETG
jgi:hypothetical protein